jgi:hypothetical protein
LAEGKRQGVEYFKAQEKIEVLKEMDKLEGSLPGVTTLVAGYRSFWDLLESEIASS